MIKKDYQLLVELLQDLNEHPEVLQNGMYNQTVGDFENDEGLFPSLCEQIIADCHAVIQAGVVGENPTQCLLTAIPPVEKHPYLEAYPVNPAYRKYIIGTFPPISYLRDHPNFVGTVLSYLNNQGDNIEVDFPMIPFYHGSRLRLWNILNIQGLNNNINRNVRVETVIDFLTANGINYFDVVKFVQRINYIADDSGLRNIVLNETDIINLTNNKIDAPILLIFNSGCSFTKTGVEIRVNNVAAGFAGEINPHNHAFDMFLYVLQKMGFAMELSMDEHNWVSVDLEHVHELNETFQLVQIFYLRVNNRVFTIVAGPSPADGDGQLQNNAVFIRFSQLHPHPVDGFALMNILDQKHAFKKYVYQNALINDNLAALFNLNG